MTANSNIAHQIQIQLFIKKYYYNAVRQEIKRNKKYARNLICVKLGNNLVCAKKEKLVINNRCKKLQDKLFLFLK